MALADFVFLIMTSVVVLILLVYMCIKNSKVNIGSVLDNSVKASVFNSTVFIIHDRSTNTICNRLITVRPFDWVVWAIRGHLYILNPEGGTKCPVGYTPAVRVYANHFVETCLSLSYETIISAYSTSSRAIIKHVPYNIGDEVAFTILTALNILTKDWITFDVSPATGASTLRDITPTADNQSGDNSRTCGGHETSQQLVSYVGRQRQTHLTSDDLEKVFKHLPRRSTYRDISFAENLHSPKIVELES